MILRELLALEYLGLTKAETLPDAAIRLVESGTLSESLVLLAGSTRRDDPRDLRELLRAAGRELGVDIRTKLDAAETLKRYWLAEVAHRRVDSAKGVHHLIYDAYQAVDDDLPNGEFVGSNWGIAELVGTFYELDDIDDPAKVESVKEDLVRLCRLLLENERAGSDY
jgi:hypothetical protein